MKYLYTLIALFIFGFGITYAALTHYTPTVVTTNTGSVNPSYTPQGPAGGAVPPSGYTAGPHPHQSVLPLTPPPGGAVPPSYTPQPHRTVVCH